MEREMIPTCPYCEKGFTYVKIQEVEMHAGFEPYHSGLTYLCPHCQKILSIQINPIKFQEELLARLDHLLRRKD